MCVCVTPKSFQIMLKLRGSTMMRLMCVWGGGGCHIKEEGLHGSRGGRLAGGACAKKDV